MLPKELFLSTLEKIQKQEARIDEFNIALYRVHFSAITKGRNSPDSNIADLICARRTQWRLERRIP